MGKTWETYAWEFYAAVSAFGRTASLFGVLVLELAAWCFDDADFVGASVVSKRVRCQCSPLSEVERLFK